MVVVVAFGQILPQAILAWPGKGCINVHASLLPHYRGAAPIQRAVMNGETKTGITTMLMEEGLDSGPMLLQTAIEISPQDTGGEIHDRLSLLGADLLVETLNQWEKGQLVPQPQDNTQSTYAAMLHAEDDRIDWGNPAIKIYNQVRGLHPWSGGRTLWGDKILKIWRTQMPVSYTHLGHFFFVSFFIFHFCIELGPVSYTHLENCRWMHFLSVKSVIKK